MILERLRKRLPGALKRQLPRTISIIKVREIESQRLNFIYRKKNRPANVLSFRYGPDYGEIFICPLVIRKDARWQGNSYRYQMTWMIVHGMIHLAGLQHERSSIVARRVWRIEERVLKKLIPK